MKCRCIPDTGRALVHNSSDVTLSEDKEGRPGPGIISGYFIAGVGIAVAKTPRNMSENRIAIVKMGRLRRWLGIRLRVIVECS